MTELRLQGIAWDTIRLKLEKVPDEGEWDSLWSHNGVILAVQRFAAREGITLPTGHAGRPKSGRRKM